jgi:hypothetical protein
MALGLGLPLGADVGLLRDLQNRWLITGSNKFQTEQAIRFLAGRHPGNGPALKTWGLGQLPGHRISKDLALV